MNLILLALALTQPVYYQAPKEVPPTIQEKIIGKAKAYGYSPERALAIVKAESGFDPDVRNAGSTASGLFQFLNGTFETYCVENFELADSLLSKNDPDVQIDCAITMLSTGGEHHWDASRKNWNMVN